MRYFKISDFDCPTENNSGQYMKRSVLVALDSARHWVQSNWNNRGKKKIVFIITSGYRTPKHNIDVGGTSQSSHVKGLAVDIAYKDINSLFVIVISLALNGFFRFGINFNKKFVHCDMDNDKRPAVWFYKSRFRLLNFIGSQFIDFNEDY